MKKIIAMILITCLVLLSTGCNYEDLDHPGDSSTPESISQEDTVPDIFDIIKPVEINKPLKLGEDGEYENITYDRPVFKEVEPRTVSFRIGQQYFYDVVLDCKYVYGDSGNDYYYSFRKNRQYSMEVYTDGGFRINFSDKSLYHCVDDDFVLEEETLIEHVKKTVLLYRDIDFHDYEAEITTSFKESGYVDGFVKPTEDTVRRYLVLFRRKEMNGVTILENIMARCDASGNINYILVEGRTDLWDECEIDMDAYLRARSRVDWLYDNVRLDVYDGRIVFSIPTLEAVVCIY